MESTTIISPSAQSLEVPPIPLESYAILAHFPALACDSRAPPASHNIAQPSALQASDSECLSNLRHARISLLTRSHIGFAGRPQYIKLPSIAFKYADYTMKPLPKLPSPTPSPKTDGYYSFVFSSDSSQTSSGLSLSPEIKAAHVANRTEYPHFDLYPPTKQCEAATSHPLEEMEETASATQLGHAAASPPLPKIPVSPLLDAVSASSLSQQVPAPILKSSDACPTEPIAEPYPSESAHTYPPPPSPHTYPPSPCAHATSYPGFDQKPSQMRSAKSEGGVKAWFETSMGKVTKYYRIAQEVVVLSFSTPLV
ncbi:hypothetical protein BOTBODRAFT_646788 [Botryobasidium botryosum FD-172 SS1]|uniref:Uncharacterized protein n=1 Tax=Botryobasidium botryosum (strain FD-172 SS1) TaxID=930990 RepID=A0A067N0J4_BOTB1|nr:hypothetical protein BOTBODRAFT_646788 [Botryobasidium botryosum FD-172 SS1]